jgi:predicted permease
MAIRQALGAGRWRLTGQILGESLLVAAIGGAAGIALAAWSSQLARTLAAGRIPRVESMAFEGPVWLFAAAISLLLGVLFGLPAWWQVMQRQYDLCFAGRSIARGRSRLSAVLMAGEVAMALMVLAGAALLTRNFAALLDENPGFSAAQVWAIPNVPLRPAWDQSAEIFTARIDPALRGVPGVLDVAAANAAPMSLGTTEHSRFATRFGIEGRVFDPGSFPVAQNRWITPGYFHLLNILLVRGKWLTESDLSKPRVLVNQALASRFFSGQDPVGKRLILGVMDAQQQAIEIAGVVGDVRDFGLDQEVEPTMYGIATGPVMTLLVKTATPPDRLAATLREAIRRADPGMPVESIQPLQQNLADSLARRRFALLLLSIFGALAAFLTAGGIYGLLTQSVNARVREFGVRAAVGAAPGELVTMILREAITLTLPGLIAGVILSLSFARVMKSLVYRLSPVDPLSIGAAAVFLAVVTFFSAWLPARRAAAVDPATALRAE